MDLLVKQTTEAGCIDPESILLGSRIRVQMKLSCRMKIHMTVKTGNAQTGFRRFSIMGRIKFLLGKLGHQEPESVELDRRDKTPKEPIKILGVQHFSLGDIAQFGMRRQKNGRREFRKKTRRKIEFHIKPLEARKLFNLHGGE